MKYNLGLDIGSISINTVLIAENRRVVENHYDFCHGRPFHRLKEVLAGILESHGEDSIATVALTGTGGLLVSELIGGHFVNELIAQATSISCQHPEVKTIIEMGGEDSKLIYMEENQGKAALTDFSMNSICAAGTGSEARQRQGPRGQHAVASRCRLRTQGHRRIAAIPWR